MTGLNTVPVNYQHLEMIIYNFNCTILFSPILAAVLARVDSFGVIKRTLESLVKSAEVDSY